MPSSGQRSEPRSSHLSLVRAEQAPLSDDELCRGFLAGDESAFGELIRRHQDLVHALVRRHASRPEDARDLAQRAFLRAFQAARRTLPRFAKEKEIPFRAWLARIAINLGKNQSRQDRRWREAPESELASAPDGAPSTLEHLQHEENARRARAAVITLPKRQREVLTLRIDGGMAFQEIADTLGITVNNAKVHFHHAVKRLKEAVSAEEER